MLVEVANAGIRWTEPRDLSVDAMGDASPGSAPVTVSSHHLADRHFFFHHAAGAHVALVDTSTRFLTVDPTAADGVNNLLTVGGARDTTLDAWNRKQLRIDWLHCLALPVWFVSAGLLLYRAVRSRKRPPVPVGAKAVG
jgi:hypothetical protein